MNPLYSCINDACGYIEKKGVNKYLIIDSINKNKELLKKYMMFLVELWVKLKK